MKIAHAFPYQNSRPTFSLIPSACVSTCLSEPARSTKFTTDVLESLLSYVCEGGDGGGDSAVPQYVRGHSMQLQLSAGASSGSGTVSGNVALLGVAKT